VVKPSQHAWAEWHNEMSDIPEQVQVRDKSVCHMVYSMLLQKYQRMLAERQAQQNASG
jgi:hypothetical protein